MPLKKLYLIGLLALCSFNVFPNSGIDKYDESTWAILILFGIILIVVFTYLFLHAYFEQLLRNKEIQRVNEEVESNTVEYNDIVKESPIPISPVYLLNLFMLKRKGVISNIEYQKLKDRLIKSRA